MRRNTALANSARRVRALAERVDPEYRPDIAGEWAALLERIENRGDAAAIREIEEWTRWVEERLSATAAQAPLVARPHPCTQPPLPSSTTSTRLSSGRAARRTPLVAAARFASASPSGTDIARTAEGGPPELDPTERTNP